MQIFPAIDLRGGQVVRLYQGDYDQETVYGADPRAQARKFLDAGARYLHVVDLDGARDGTLANFDSIAAIAKQGGLYIEVGGGIRTEERVRRYLDLGVGRCILGTIAVKDFDFTIRMARTYGDRIAVGVDARDGYVAVNGWKELSRERGVDFCRRLRDGGVGTVIYTDISRDGAGRGTNLELYEELVRIGANLIITHEPTWFTGNDATDWCAQDSVYLAKRNYLEEHGITVWRLHDHMHLGSDKDYIYEGLLSELGWHQYLLPDEKYPWIYEVPQTTVGELAAFFKEKLDMRTIQIIGAPEMKVKRLGILVGGGSLGFGSEPMPMEVMERNQLDLLVVGDITEWTICAYINDAYQMGLHRAMLTLGHERSEEAGMKHLAPWLKERFTDLPVSFVDAKEPFKYL